jgi:hypothetical protein
LAEAVATSYGLMQRSKSSAMVREYVEKTGVISRSERDCAARAVRKGSMSKKFFCRLFMAALPWQPIYSQDVKHAPTQSSTSLDQDYSKMPFTFEAKHFDTDCKSPTSCHWITVTASCIRQPREKDSASNGASSSPATYCRLPKMAALLQ